MHAERAVLTDRGVIEVSGQDARDFLQRLITNDVEALRPGEARYAALLTPQGKITADFFVVPVPSETADRFLLDTPATLVEALVKRLGIYRLRAKVTIADLSEDFAVVAFEGERAPVTTIAAYADPRSASLWHRGIVERAAVQDMGDDAGRWAYREQRITAGVPEGGIDFVYGETFPHEANFDRLHGVDFKKGCYIGQEVVSRVQHRGTARKRILPVRFSGEPPAVGSDITLDGLSIGTMGSTADGIGLGLIRLDRVEEGRPGQGRVLAGDVAVEVDSAGWNPDAKSA